jgi:uncharacterized protein
MTAVFVDTAALIALGNKQDKWHHQAVAISRQLTLAGCRFVTTDALRKKRSAHPTCLAQSPRL